MKNKRKSATSCLNKIHSYFKSPYIDFEPSDDETSYDEVSDNDSDTDEDVTTDSDSSTNEDIVDEVANNDFTTIGNLKNNNVDLDNVDDDVILKETIPNISKISTKNYLKSIEMASLHIRARDPNMDSGLSLLKSHFKTHFNYFNQLSQSAYWADKILINSDNKCEVFGYLNEAFFPTKEFMVDISKTRRKLDILGSLSSISVTLSTEIPLKHTLLPPLSSLIVPNPVVDQHGAFINAGTYVKRMCWAPLNPELHLEQFLAVTVYKELTDRCNVYENANGNDEMIQIYNCGDLQMNTKEASPARLEMVLTHNWGKVTDMSWSPQPLPAVSRSQRLIGHLALCCTDGFIRIIPIAKLSNPGVLVELDNNHPILCLGFKRVKECRNVYPTTMHWRYQFPDRIVAGYNNGRVSSFILESCVFSTRAKCSDNNIYLKPSITRRVFDGPCRSIQISPYNWRIVLCSSSVSPHAVVIDFEQPTERNFPSPIDFEPTIGSRLLWPSPGDMVVLASGRHLSNIPGLLICAAQTPARRSRKLILPEISSMDLCHSLNIIPIGTRSGELSIFSLNTNQVNCLLKGRTLHGKESRGGAMKNKSYFQYCAIPNEQVDSPALTKSEYRMSAPICACPPNLQCVHKLIQNYSISVKKTVPNKSHDWQFDFMLNINEIASNPNPGSCTWIAVSLECGLIHLVPLTHFYRSDLDELSNGSSCNMLNDSARRLFDDLLLAKNLVYFPKCGRPRKSNFVIKKSEAISVSNSQMESTVNEPSDIFVFPTTPKSTKPKTKITRITDYFTNPIVKLEDYSIAGVSSNNRQSPTKLTKSVNRNPRRVTIRKSKSGSVSKIVGPKKKSIRISKKMLQVEDSDDISTNESIDVPLVSPFRKRLSGLKENLQLNNNSISAKNILKFPKQNSPSTRFKLRSDDFNQGISDSTSSFAHPSPASPRKRFFLKESNNNDNIPEPMKITESINNGSNPIRKRLRSYHSESSDAENPVILKSSPINERVTRSRTTSHNLSAVETSTIDPPDSSTCISPVKVAISVKNKKRIISKADSQTNKKTDKINAKKVDKLLDIDIDSSVNAADVSTNERVTRSRTISQHNLSTLESPHKDIIDNAPRNNPMKVGESIKNIAKLNKKQKISKTNDQTNTEINITDSFASRVVKIVIENSSEITNGINTKSPVNPIERVTRSRTTSHDVSAIDSSTNEPNNIASRITPLKAEISMKTSETANKKQVISKINSATNEKIVINESSSSKTGKIIVESPRVKNVVKSKEIEAVSSLSTKDPSISERVTRSRVFSHSASALEITNELIDNSTSDSPIKAGRTPKKSNPMVNNKPVISKTSRHINKNVISDECPSMTKEQRIVDGPSVETVDKSKKITTKSTLKILKRKNSQQNSEKSTKKSKIDNLRSSKSVKEPLKTNASFDSSHSPSFSTDHDSSDIEEVMPVKNLEKLADKNINVMGRKDFVNLVNDSGTVQKSKVPNIKPFKRILNTDIDCEYNEVDIDANHPPNVAHQSASSNIGLSLNSRPVDSLLSKRSEEHPVHTKFTTPTMRSIDKPERCVNQSQFNNVSSMSMTKLNTLEFVPKSQSTPISQQNKHADSISTDPLLVLVKPRNKVTSTKEKKSKSKSELYDKTKLMKLQNIFSLKRQELFDSQSIKANTTDPPAPPAPPAIASPVPVKSNWWGVDNIEDRSNDADLDINKIDDISLGISPKKKTNSKSFVEDRMDKIKKVITRGVSQSVIDINTVKDGLPELLQPFRPLKASKSLHCSQINNA